MWRSVRPAPRSVSVKPNSGKGFRRPIGASRSLRPEDFAAVKGARQPDRLARSPKADLMEHLKGVKRLHEEDLRAGYGRVHPHYPPWSSSLQ